MSVRDVLLEQPEGEMPAGVCGADPAPPCPLARDEAERRAALLKAVADPVRLQLLAIITAAPEEACASRHDRRQPGLSQPTVSHHLKVLVEAGILTRERRGSWAWFALVPGASPRSPASSAEPPRPGAGPSRGVGSFGPDDAS